MKHATVLDAAKEAQKLINELENATHELNLVTNLPFGR